MTRGTGLPGELSALRKKRLAAAASRLAVSRNSVVWPFESTARYRIFVLALYLYIGLVGAVALAAGLQMRATALVQLRRISLDPAPDTTGVHFDATVRQQFSDMLVSQRITEIPADAEEDQVAWEMAAFERIGGGD